MKFGLILPQNTDDPKQPLQAAKLCEKAGLDSIWVVDNLQERPDPRVPFLEALVTLSAAAAVTERIRLGTMVLRVTLRVPRVAAAMAATLDRIAPGRLIVAMGVADSSSREEQEACGIPFEPKSVRFRQLEDTVSAMREAAPEVPLWLGGESDQTIAYSELFDGWNYWGHSSNFPEKARKARESAGDRRLEVSWAGPRRDFEPDALREAEADHAIFATNAANYLRRIEIVQELMDQHGESQS